MTKQKLKPKDRSILTRFCLFAVVPALLCCLVLQSSVLASAISPDTQVLLSQYPPDSSGPSLADGRDEFENFEVIPSFPIVGEESSYDLNFELNQGDYRKLDKGGFVFLFPDRFDLRQISLVTIGDDESKPRYRVERFSSTGHFLFVTLKKNGHHDDDDDDGDDRFDTKTRINLHVESITNASRPGLYKIAGLAYNKKKHLVAGPTLSNSFELVGSGTDIAGLIVLPEEDQNVPLGGSISFSSWTVDQSGNTLNEVNASWTFTDDSDPIGSLNGSLFTAESVGIGRVRAEFDNFEAISGMIRVMSGPSLSYVSGSLTPLTMTAGVERKFSFEVLLDRAFPEDVVINSATFTLSGVAYSTTVELKSESGLLLPGINWVYSEPIIVPESQVGNSLSIRAEIIYSPLSSPGSIFTFTSNLDNASVLVESAPVVQIISLETIALNSPRVNVGQSYKISCKVANLSDSKATSLTLHLFSDGASIFTPLLITPEIAPGDTVEVFYELIASEAPNNHEHLVVNIIESGEVPPLDNTTLVIIETPANLELSYSLSGLSNGFVHPGSIFSLTVELENMGEASGSDAVYSIETGGVDFGDEFDSIGTLTVESHRKFQFKAPLDETSAVITFTLTDIPVDLNTGQRAPILDTSFQFTITVRMIEGGLAADFVSDRLNLIMPGRSKNMFAMNLTNLLEAKTYSIALNSMSIFVYSGGQPVDAASVFDLGETDFFRGGYEVSLLVAAGNRLDFTFEDLVIAPLNGVIAELRTVALKTDLRDITLEIDIADMEARYFDGPAVGELAPISSSGDSKVSFNYVFKGPTLEQSVVIERNPFNPDEELMHFTYELPVASDIDFRILTLTGEEVYSLDIPFGSAGASMVGENEISWDGRNDKGYTVLNGVYIVFVRIVETGESTHTKVAVVK